MDQAAALAHALTPPRVAEILIGPAVGQDARNVLASVGVDRAENTASFLGHLPGQRGARGIARTCQGARCCLTRRR
jgi:hypothetical protein